MTAPWAQGTLSDTVLYAGGNITSPLARLLQHCALGGLHDAAERPDPPKCHENTRVAILDRINLWARDKSVNAKRILWLRGAAGSGKSAIAQTSIERWREDNLIVPNFFLWRTAAQRNQKIHILPTIAFQLTKLLPATGPIIKEAVRDGSIFKQNLRAQVEALVITPLHANSDSVIIVLDGLDECCVSMPRSEGFPGQHYEDQQREILDAIAFACHQVPSLRVLIASRPERQIRKSFARNPLATLSLSLSLNNEADATADISLYLNCEFAVIRSEHPEIKPSWPSQQQIHKLIEKSSGQFIYPSIVVKYISRSRQYPPTSLDEVLALHPKAANQESHPLAELDALYTLVLKTVSEVSLPVVKIILGRMVYSEETICNIFKGIEARNNTLYLEKFLLLQDGELATHLTDLHSILSISTNPEDGLTRIRLFHATFSEYLKDKFRSGDFFISESDVDLQISLLLLRHATIEQPPNASVYDLSQLFIWLARFINGSPPFIDLMKGLWSLLKDEIGEYSLISSSTPNLGTCQSTHVGGRPKYFQGAIFRHLLTQDQCLLLSYLQKCNIPEIEPLETCQKAVGAHLHDLGGLIHPDGACNRLFGCPFAQPLDTGNTEDSKEEHGEEAESSHQLKGIPTSDTDDTKNSETDPSPPASPPLPQEEMAHDDLEPPSNDQSGPTKTKEKSPFGQLWLAITFRFSQRKREQSRSL